MFGALKADVHLLSWESHRDRAKDCLKPVGNASLRFLFSRQILTKFHIQTTKTLMMTPGDNALQILMEEYFLFHYDREMQGIQHALSGEGVNT